MDMPRRQIETASSPRFRQFRREPGLLIRAARSASALLIRGWLRLYHRFSIVGRENLPTDRSFVLVANHNSHLDALCLLSSLPLGKLHRAFPAAARDYFFDCLPARLAATVVNALPFDRQADVRESLDVCRELLEHPENVLVIFPEGTRSLTGEVGEFKPGVGLLVAGRPVPVVPCYLEGAGAAWPKGVCVPRPRRVRLTIGRPREFADRPRDKESVLQICRELRQAVVDLASPANDTAR